MDEDEDEDEHELATAIRGRGAPLLRRPPDRVTAGKRGPIPPASRVFTILMFSALFLLGRRWKEKSRTSTPMLEAVAPSEIAALVSLLASLIYLVPALLSAKSQDLESSDQ